MQPAPGFQQARIDHLNPGNIDVLRLDLVHPVISGNKWYKLRFYLEEALHSGKNSMMSFGGAWSNHIIALAAAAQMNGLKSIGLIRGEKPKELSMTLNEAIGYGMKLYFLSRSNYAENKIPEEVWDQINKNDVYLVREGGYGLIGAAGAATILDEIDFQHYDYIMAATGTGTMLAGLALRMEPEQKLVGISVLKNNYSITKEINDLLPDHKKDHFTIMHQYHFGGYAKGCPDLFHFMNQWYEETHIPTDFVYTAKVFYALKDMLKNEYFPKHSRILVIHSGGLQGNSSLPNGTLIF